MTKPRDLANSVNPDAIPGTRLEDGGVTEAKVADAAITLAKLSPAAVTQSQTDTTAGRLTKVGDFGVGASGVGLPVLTTFDDASIPAGFYRFEGGTTDQLPFAGGGGGAIKLDRRDGQAAWIATRTAGPAGESIPRLYVRSTSGTGTDDWGDWHEVYSQRRILGTVSQSSGVPTGAIIERGSNANGEFVRYADGTQICWRIANGANLTITTTQTFPFPAAFDASFPVACSVSVQLDSLYPSNDDNFAVGSATVGTGHTDLSAWLLRVTQAGTLASTERVRLMAIGRWY